MPRRNRNAHATALNTDALADQALGLAGDLHQHGPHGTPRSHLAIRIDPLPPWFEHDARTYWCPACGYLTGAEQRTAAIPHEIPGLDRRITHADLNLPEPQLHTPGCDCTRCLLAPFTTRR